MREYRFAISTAVAAFLLIVIGGLVHPTGSSLACPDWPLCNGAALPPLRGGVLFEHGHRLAALTVAVMTAILTALVVRARPDPGVRRLAVATLALVAGEAALGALTVVFELPLLASTGHLAISMAFLAAVIALAHRLRPGAGPVEAAAQPPSPLPRALAAAAVAATWASIVIGAVVRHTGSALACDGAVLCGGLVWPAGGAARIQMLHRLWNWGLVLLVLTTAWAVLRARETPRPARVLAAAAPLLLVAQGLLGILTIETAVSVPVVSLHLAVGALTLADLVGLFLVLRPRAAGVAPGRLAPVAG